MLEFRDVTKRFVRSHSVRHVFSRSADRYVTALDGVSFRCDPGEIVGLVGPNGAGKTTLAKLAVNLLLPDAGEILIAGKRATSGSHELRRHVSLVMADDRTFFSRLSGIDNLRFFLALYGHSNLKPALELAETLELSRHLKRPFAGYSTGMRKKLAIIRALMTNPRIMLLDEATNGLDPTSVIQLKRIVREHCRNCAVIWATHRLEEVGDLCTRLLVLSNGGVTFDGKPSECGFGGEASLAALDEIYLSLVGS